jgi:hypothetical protein
VTGLSLADVTARWKSVSPRERFRLRGDLLRAAESLDTSAARVRDLVLDRDLARDFDYALTLALDLERDTARVRVRDLDRDLDLARDRGRARDLDIDLTRDLIEARDNLTAAADNFVGADLTTVDPVEIDLAGVRWGSDTRWPTPEWTARIRRASVEGPPGSGVFIVIPEESHDFANRGSLAPIS